MSLALALAAFLAAFLLLYFIRRRSRFPLPPGPPGYPLLGNKKELIRGPGREHAWIEYAKLGAKYGDIVYLKSFGQGLVILNSPKPAFDLLEKRSSNYSDRPVMTMVTELMGWDWSFGFMGYSDRWRLHRKTFHQYFQQRAIPAYEPLIQHYGYELLHRLLTSPRDFQSHISYFTGSIILKTIYNYDLQGDQDPYIKLFEEAIESLTIATNPGTFLVDLIPVLKYIPAWFPCAGFQRKARIWNRAVRRFVDVPYENARRRVASGDASQSLVAKCLRKKESSPDTLEYSEDVIKHCSATAFVAGDETSSATILSFILAMVLNRSVLQKAQEEMDRVIGHSRLPHFEDRSRLPYFEAVFLETLRWLPVAPLGLPHRSVHDDIYNGHFIPKGMTYWNLNGLTRAMLHDPKTYPQPSEFIPERFLPDDGKDMPPLPTDFAFGFGRRICPGRYFAMSVAWLALATIVATFDIGKAKDDSGNEISPIVDVNDGAACRPLPFQCSITPRSTQAILLIEKRDAKE